MPKSIRLFCIPLLLAISSPSFGAVLGGTTPPGAAFQFKPCLSEEQRTIATRNLSRSLRDPATGANPDVRSVCSDPNDFFSGVETLGVWLTPLPPEGILGGGALRAVVDGARNRGLASISLLRDMELFAWWVGQPFLEELRARAWETMDKRFNDNGDVDDDGKIHLTRLTFRLIEPDSIRTEVRGYYDDIVDVDFRVRISDTITIDDDKLRVDGQTDLYIDTNLVNWLAGVFTVVLPPLGLELFDRIDRADNGQLPDLESKSFGALIGTSAPNQFMTAGGRKINFAHERFLVESTGVSGGGDSQDIARHPSVAIGGPRGPIVTTRTVTFRYTMTPTDLRATGRNPLAIEWTSSGTVVNPGAATTDIQFQIPFNVAVGADSEQWVRVRVTDADGLQAARRIAVRIRYEPDGRPPICRTKAWLPECTVGVDRR